MDRHVARKIIIDMDDVDNDLSDPGDVNSTTTDPVEHAGDISSEADYQSIKAMADADHEVSFHPMAWYGILMGHSGSKLQIERRAYSRHSSHFPTRQGT